MERDNNRVRIRREHGTTHCQIDLKILLVVVMPWSSCCGCCRCAAVVVLLLLLRRWTDEALLLRERGKRGGEVTTVVWRIRWCYRCAAAVLLLLLLLPSSLSLWRRHYFALFDVLVDQRTVISTTNRVTSRGLFLPVCTVNLVLPETEIMKR